MRLSRRASDDRFLLTARRRIGKMGDRVRHPAFQRIFDRAEKPKGPDVR